MSSYIKKKSAKQEKRTAKEFGGRTQVASGAKDGAKGDVRTPEFLIENKYTDADTYKFELRIWNKIQREATRDGLREPLMQIDIQDLQLLVMDFNLFVELFENAEVSFFNTPHKSAKLAKKALQYIELEPAAYVLSFGATQLAVVSNLQFFLLDK